MKDKQQGNQGQGKALGHDKSDDHGKGQGHDKHDQGHWGQGNQGQGQGNYGSGSQGKGNEGQGYISQPDQGESRGFGNRDQDSVPEWHSPETTPRGRDAGDGDMSGQVDEGDHGRQTTGSTDMSGQAGRDRGSSDS